MNVNERVTRTTRARATIKKTLRNIYTELSFQIFIRDSDIDWVTVMLVIS